MANPTKWSNTLKQFIAKLPTNFLSVFDHFVGLALKGLTWLKCVLITDCKYTSVTIAIDYRFHFRLKQQSYPNSNSDDVKFYCTLVCACLLPFLKSILVNFFGTNSLNEMNGRLPSTLTSTQVKAIYILETEQYVNLLKEFVDKDDLYESVKVEAGKESPQKDIIENDIELDKEIQPPSEGISVDESGLATGDISADILRE